MRFAQKFHKSTCIFATNNVKYHVNHTRARRFAAEKHQRLHYAIAEDRASAEVLAAKRHLDKDKVTWLRRPRSRSRRPLRHLAIVHGYACSCHRPRGSREGRAAQMSRTSLRLDARQPERGAEQTGRSPLLDGVAYRSGCAIQNPEKVSRQGHGPEIASFQWHGSLGRSVRPFGQRRK